MLDLHQMLCWRCCGAITPRSARGALAPQPCRLTFCPWISLPLWRYAALMALDLRDRFETTDGSRPTSEPLSEAHGRELKLAAFAILEGGDVVEGGSAAKQSDSDARAFVRERVQLEPADLAPELKKRIESDIVAQLGTNPHLAARLSLAKSIRVDVVPAGSSLASVGFPKTVAERAAGLFWDHSSWERARIALRQEHLVEDRSLVFHEMAHAVFYLGFTRAEQDLVYRLLRPSFGSRAAMDEVFAIYSEVELAGAFGERDLKAPGIYGHTRRQWSEDHVFTRFVRKLYFPSRPLAGPGMKPLKDGSWMTRLGR
jgi:hypothetical protein